MGKPLGVLTAVFFMILWSAEGVLAQTTKSVQAGIAAEVKGDVTATTLSERTAHRLKNGDKIFMADKIETGAEGELQILLLDQTFFTLGPLSTITVDEFIYDPGKAGAKSGVVKGIFRAVSSKVAEKEIQDVTDTDTTVSSPEAREELKSAIDAVDIPATRRNQSAVSQKLPA